MVGIIEQVNKYFCLSYNVHHYRMLTITEYAPLHYYTLQNTHHYRILTEYSQLQNEQRKAKRLTELMVELQLDSSKILTDQVIVSILLNFNFIIHALMEI